MTFDHSRMVFDDQFHADALERTVTHAIIAHSLTKPSKRRAIPRAEYPMMVELDYGNHLASLVHRLRPAYHALLAALPRLLADAPRVYKDADRADVGEAAFARKLLEQAKEKANGLITPEEMEQLGRLYGGRTSQAQKAQLGKQIKAGLGVDLPIGDPAADRELVEYFAHENAQLISTIPEDMHSEIANLTMRAFSKRMDPETLGKLIEERFGVAESRARFIARDQVGKLNGQIAMVRMRHLGIDRYTWQTKRDPRVRPSHAAREGNEYEFSKPPTSDGPRDGNPGDPPGCRCTARPVLDNLIAAIAARRQHVQPSVTTRGTNRIRPAPP